ncbi:hypothetical protein L596_014186 [Steinernema carpocapsae]|uniref:Uncharacterized protein n=1 Tax=Steinernema carpocapsae TaxID=34508 RepID=A0A4U5NC03_STECR|nr:hypothetical protein L596_014186 [Steinernema carpocapsae]
MDSKDSASKSPDENVSKDPPGPFVNKDSISKGVLAEAQLVNARVPQSHAGDPSDHDSEAGPSASSSRKRESETPNGESGSKRAKTDEEAEQGQKASGPSQPGPSYAGAVQNGALNDLLMLPDDIVNVPNLPVGESDVEEGGERREEAGERADGLGPEVLRIPEGENPVDDPMRPGAYRPEPARAEEVAPDLESSESSSAEDPGPGPSNAPPRRRRRRRRSSSSGIVDISDDEQIPQTPMPPGTAPPPQRPPRPQPTLQELLEFEWEDVPDDPEQN